MLEALSSSVHVAEGNTAEMALVAGRQAGNARAHGSE